jgi:hypothetical protein
MIQEGWAKRLRQVKALGKNLSGKKPWLPGWGRLLVKDFWARGTVHSRQWR